MPHHWSRPQIAGGGGEEHGGMRGVGAVGREGLFLLVGEGEVGRDRGDRGGGREGA